MILLNYVFLKSNIFQIHIYKKSLKILHNKVLSKIKQLAKIIKNSFQNFNKIDNIQPIKLFNQKYFIQQILQNNKKTPYIS